MVLISSLSAAGLATGKRVTCYQHVRREAELAGATFVDKRQCATDA